MNAARKIRVGSKIDLATDDITRSYGIKGTGTVTAIKLTDPMNGYSTVLISTRSGFLHVPGIRVTQPKESR